MWLSKVRLRSEVSVPVYQRPQLLQLLLLGAFQVLQPSTQQGQLPLMLFLLPHRGDAMKTRKCHNSTTQAELLRKLNNVTSYTLIIIMINSLLCQLVSNLLLFKSTLCLLDAAFEGKPFSHPQTGCGLCQYCGFAFLESVNWNFHFV